jgi:hypothetical protein
LRARAAVFFAACLAAFGCGSDFAPKNAVRGVRILAARADLPYARPGETVHVEALAHDGRKTPAEPMRLFWFPAPCIDPPGGQYFGCYPLFDAVFPVGVDLTPVLHEAKDVSITVPADALARTTARPGQGERFATAWVFMVACPGHVERVPRRSGLALNALPVGCFSASGQALAPEDFVFGYTRIFVFESRRNALPKLDGITFEGSRVDAVAGIVTKCEKDPRTNACKSRKLDALFADSIAEPDPDNVSVDGQVGRETVYVDWFTSAGEFEDNRRILFDGNLGRPPKATVDFTPPEQPMKGTGWAVLHDNRGGTTWLEFPLQIE